MKIVIDICHPADIHYFRNLINLLKSKGHEFLVISREREYTNYLLNHYNIPFISRGKGKDGLIGKLLYMVYADYLFIKHARKFKPDLFLSFGSPYAAHASFFLGVPHITLNDTEHTDKTHRIFTYPFSSVILTPASYQNNLGRKHIRFNAVMESCYLHPDYFSHDKQIKKLLGINNDEKYAILRFVSWNAFHDVNQNGLSIEQKRQIVTLLKSKFKLFISSERELEDEFEEYRIKIPPEKMHDALAEATIFVGESGTMASESALLGTPVVYVNSLPLMCYLKLQQEHGLLKHFKTGNGVVDYIATLIEDNKLKENAIKKRDTMVSDFINPTPFFARFIENYPRSFNVLKENPDRQNAFSCAI